MLSVPSPLRYWLARNKTLVREVHKILAETVEEFYCERKDKKTRSGAITFIQRFGGAINLNVHFHMLQIEGLYQEKSTGHHKFIKTPSPLDDDIKNLVEVIRDKIIQLLISCGYISEYEEEVTTPQDPLLEEEPAYAESMSASVKYMIAFGKRRGQRVRFHSKEFSHHGSEAQIRSPLCAYVDGFSLHAGLIDVML